MKLRTINWCTTNNEEEKVRKYISFKCTMLGQNNK